jgi:hypothetical protein
MTVITGDPNLGEFADAVVLFTVGEVPDDIPGDRAEIKFKRLAAPR